MAYEFKKLSDVEVVETPTDAANVLIEEDGVIKKAPKTAISGDNSNNDRYSNYDLIIKGDSREASSSANYKWYLIKGDFEYLKNKLLTSEEEVNALCYVVTSYGRSYYQVNNVFYDDESYGIVVDIYTHVTADDFSDDRLFISSDDTAGSQL